MKKKKELKVTVGYQPTPFLDEEKTLMAGFKPADLTPDADEQKVSISISPRPLVSFTCSIEGPGIEAERYDFFIILSEKKTLNVFSFTTIGPSPLVEKKTPMTGEPYFEYAPDFQPIMLAIRGHKLKKKEVARLRGYMKQAGQGDIDPQAVDYFGELLRAILEASGYDVEIKPAPLPAIKAGLHLELQKFGQTDEKQLSLWATGKGSPLYQDDGLPGIALDANEEIALMGIQKLLTDTNYYGNRPGKFLDDPNSEHKFTGYLPIIEISFPRFMDACGARKVKTGRNKWEYDRGERDSILKGLDGLESPRRMGYERKYNEGGKEKSDLIAYSAPLVRVVKGFKGLSQGEARKIKQGDENPSKMKTLWLEVAPIVVDQIESYFVLKAGDMQAEIKTACKAKGKRVSKFYQGFINYLITQAELKRRNNETDYTLDRYEKTLATKLRMDAMINNRKWSRIRKILKECCDIAKSLGYLQKYKYAEGPKGKKLILELSPGKCLLVKPLTDGNQKN